jgi:hypothetical protein
VLYKIRPKSRPALMQQWQCKQGYIEASTHSGK